MRVMADYGIGRYIKEERAKRGLTQDALAEAAGIQRPHLAQIERGRIALPGADLRRRLAAALGVDHVDLLIAAGELTEEECRPSRAPTDPLDQPLADIRRTATNHPHPILFASRVATVASAMAVAEARYSVLSEPHAGRNSSNPGPRRRRGL